MGLPRHPATALAAVVWTLCVAVAPAAAQDECGGNSACGGQSCQDPDTAVANNWKCVCLPPESGERVGGPATCTLDECKLSAAATACGDAMQDCEDTNQALAARDDWRCICRSPATGSAQAKAAACTLDECTASCDTCENNLCSNAGQDCVEASSSADALRDWSCECKAPAQGSAQNRAASCYLNECSTMCASCDNDKVCTAAGQICDDVFDGPDETGDWYCVCLDPKVGSAQAMVADCTLDECTTTCSSCAGSTCSDANQDCDDGTMDPEELNNWMCVCRAPLSGTATKGVAFCGLDECTAMCMTCAGSTCTDVMQMCEDPNQDVMATGDWECRCVAPESGTGMGTAAVCEIDECTAVCDACENDKCSNAGQTCTDPDPTMELNWVCDCKAPAMGMSVTRNTASCSLDECAAMCPTCAGTTCPMGTQECVDPNTDASSRGDWECRCTGDYTGTAMMAAAVCMLDECITRGTACTKYDQDCEDTDQTTMDSWLCLCRDPSMGSAARAAALCVLDECAANCGTCERDLCFRAGQVCADPVKAHNVTSDWTCSCTAPNVGMAVAGEADCILDECAADCPTCEKGACDNNMQTCDDPDKNKFVKRDWTCTCNGMYETGMAIGMTAVCILNECEQPCPTCAGMTCAGAPSAQTCEDPDPRAASPMDWECVCDAPATQRATMAIATCTVNECEDMCPTCAGGKCSARGQNCEDADIDVNALNNWECVCVPPKQGRSSISAAYCDIDECEVSCASCAYTTCEDEGQICDDPKPKEDALSDWVCNCPLPSRGSAVAEAADCALDECLVTSCPFCAGSICTDAGQRCQDIYPYLNSKNDWECVCAEPLIGRREKGVATCTSPAPTPAPAGLTPAPPTPEPANTSTATATDNTTFTANTSTVTPTETANGTDTTTGTAGNTTTTNMSDITTAPATAAPLFTSVPWFGNNTLAPWRSMTDGPTAVPGGGVSRAPGTYAPVTDTPIGLLTQAPDGNETAGAAEEDFLEENVGWLVSLVLVLCICCAAVVFACGRKQRWLGFQHENRESEALRGYSHAFEDEELNDVNKSFLNATAVTSEAPRSPQSPGDGTIKTASWEEPKPLLVSPTAGLLGGGSLGAPTSPMAPGVGVNPYAPQRPPGYGPQALSQSYPSGHLGVQGSTGSILGPESDAVTNEAPGFEQNSGYASSMTPGHQNTVPNLAHRKYPVIPRGTGGVRPHMASPFSSPRSITSRGVVSARAQAHTYV